MYTRWKKITALRQEKGLQQQKKKSSEMFFSPSLGPRISGSQHALRQRVSVWFERAPERVLNTCRWGPWLLALGVVFLPLHPRALGPE